MKITKNELRQIIKEELNEATKYSTEDLIRFDKELGKLFSNAGIDIKTINIKDRNDLLLTVELPSAKSKYGYDAKAIKDILSNKRAVAVGGRLYITFK